MRQDPPAPMLPWRPSRSWRTECGWKGSSRCPRRPAGVVLFAHGSGSSRHSPRNTYVARVLRAGGPGNAAVRPADHGRRPRLRDALRHSAADVPAVGRDPLVAARIPDGGAADRIFRREHRCRCRARRRRRNAEPRVGAVVSRGGRPDLAGATALPRVTAPTLLIVGGHDPTVIALNREAYAQSRVREGAAHRPRSNPPVRGARHARAGCGGSVRLVCALARERTDPDSGDREPHPALTNINVARSTPPETVGMATGSRSAATSSGRDIRLAPWHSADRRARRGACQRRRPAILESAARLGRLLVVVFAARRHLVDARRGQAAIAAAGRSRFEALVRLARARSPFYRDAYRGLPTGKLDPAALPVVTKRALMNRFDDWVTDPALDLAGVTAFLADREHIGERYLGRYVIWKSSGSTGEPGIYVQDGDALETFDALMAVHLDPARFAAATCAGSIAARGGRAALIAATGDHFASIASWQRLTRNSPWIAARGFSIMDPLPRLVARSTPIGRRSSRATRRCCRCWPTSARPGGSRSIRCACGRAANACPRARASRSSRRSGAPSSTNTALRSA